MKKLLLLFVLYTYSASCQTAMSVETPHFPVDLVYPNNHTKIGAFSTEQYLTPESYGFKGKIKSISITSKSEDLLFKVLLPATCEFAFDEQQLISGFTKKDELWAEYEYNSFKQLIHKKVFQTNALTKAKELKDELFYSYNNQGNIDTIKKTTHDIILHGKDIKSIFCLIYDDQQRVIEAKHLQSEHMFLSAPIPADVQKRVDSLTSQFKMEEAMDLLKQSKKNAPEFFLTEKSTTNSKDGTMSLFTCKGEDNCTEILSFKREAINNKTTKIITSLNGRINSETTITLDPSNQISTYKASSSLGKVSSVYKYKKGLLNSIFEENSTLGNSRTVYTYDKQGNWTSIKKTNITNNKVAFEITSKINYW